MHQPQPPLSVDFIAVTLHNLTSFFAPVIITTATRCCRPEIYVNMGRTKLLAQTIYAIYLMRIGSLWRCFWNIVLGVKPRTYPEEMGIIPARTGISQELEDVVEEKDIRASLLCLNREWLQINSGF